MAVVPPMSKASTLGRFASCAKWAAPSVPAAGPDSMICTGNSRANSTELMPPLDCISSSSPLNPRPRTRSSSFVRYREVTGLA